MAAAVAESTGVAWLNGLPAAAAEAEMLKVCHSTAWARQVAALRPFASERAVELAGADVWAALGRPDWLEAIQAHPPLGSRRRAPRDKSAWESEESAACAAGEDAVLAALDEVNAAYHARFGYVALVCATGKSAAELLAIIQRRMANEPEVELAVAAEQSGLITTLRLRKMFAEATSRL